MISLHHTIALDGLPATAARALLHAADLLHSMSVDLAHEAGSPAPARILDARVIGVEDTATSHRAVRPSLAGKVVAFSGHLSFPRPHAARLAVMAGARVQERVTSAVDYLVLGSEPGSRLAAAESIGVEVIDEARFLDLLGDVFVDHDAPATDNVVIGFLRPGSLS